jgi:hypothetical protein
MCAAFSVMRSTNIEQAEPVIDFDEALIDEPNSGFDMAIRALFILGRVKSDNT